MAVSFHDESLKILDICNISKDALLQMKEGLTKSLKKSFQKVVKNLKVYQYKQNEEPSAVFGEAEAVTVDVFQSHFSFMSGSKTGAKWSLVSKLMHQNKTTFEAEANEFTAKSLKLEEVQMLKSCVRDLEDGLDSLSKSLIKYRVSILTVL
ncbi:hypothetical protein N665_0320s0052 [Sinapis alba]|nr:hypothetical protein N665_0320s0052 [Sinapis alba]